LSLTNLPGLNHAPSMIFPLQNLLSFSLHSSPLDDKPLIASFPFLEVKNKIFLLSPFLCSGLPTYSPRTSRISSSQEMNKLFFPPCAGRGLFGMAFCQKIQGLADDLLLSFSPPARYLSVLFFLPRIFFFLATSGRFLFFFLGVAGCCLCSGGDLPPLFLKGHLFSFVWSFFNRNILFFFLHLPDCHFPSPGGVPRCWKKFGPFPDDGKLDFFLL